MLGTAQPLANPVRLPSKSAIISRNGISHRIYLVTEGSFSTFRFWTDYFALPAYVEGWKKQCEQVLRAATIGLTVAS